MRHLRNLIILTLALVACFSIVSCDKEEEDENPAIDRGEFNPDSFEFIVTNEDSTTSTYRYNGASDMVTIDTIVFTIPTNRSSYTFDCQVKFYEKGNDLNAGIKNASDRYLVCYRENDFFDLSLLAYDQDINGLRLGLNTEWLAHSRNNSGYMRISINYHIQTKNENCESGVVLFDGKIPYRIE